MINTKKTLDTVIKTKFLFQNEERNKKFNEKKNENLVQTKKK